LRAPRASATILAGEHRADAMTEPFLLTASAASRLMAKREISSEELVRSCLERVRARESTVQAWAHLDETMALAAARAADAVWAAGRSAQPGPLHGVPFAAKDVIDSADLPTECGSEIFSGHRPAKDAACIAAMKQAGAILLGKTVATEFATYRPGKTRNPHNPAHTPGGSSSGSAAAVADCMVPLAFGNQTAGSHIRPASYCGICAFKPTHGTVDLAGILPLEQSFDTLGYYARSFDDIALYYATVRRVPPAPARDGLGRPLRVGFYRALERQHAQPASTAAVETAARRLAELGAVVEEMDLPPEYADLAETHPLILNVGLSRSLKDIYDQHHNRLSERLRGMIEDGLACPPERYREAMDHADECRRGINQAFGGFDVLLAPSAPGEAPEGLGSTGSPVFQIVWTLLHVPCANIPGATGPQGLPVGVQFIGRQHDDGTVLAAAKWFHNRWN
jgi:Asp-tRNA(Asn)/Glu-tRNA(Gln) amidotransferase A subunit family amidase